MANFLRSFSHIDRRSVSKVDCWSLESDSVEHEKVEDPESWNLPILSSKEVYPIPYLFSLSKKVWLKEVELKIKISGPSVQIVGLNLFSEDEIKKFRKYVAEKKFSYLHFGGIRIGLAPLFHHGLNTPCIAEVFDTRHNIYDHAWIRTILGNLSLGCQYGTIYLDYAISLSDIHLKDCWKALVGVQGLEMVQDNEYLSVLIQNLFPTDQYCTS